MKFARVRGAVVFLTAILAGMIVWHFTIRMFVNHHPDNPAAQALAGLI